MAPRSQGRGLPEGLTPHELRHTAASLLIAQGAGPKSIQAQLGHSTITTTFDTYGHLFEGHLDEVMERLDQRRRVTQEDAAGDVVPLTDHARQDSHERRIG